MWKSLAKPHECCFSYVEKNVDRFSVFHRHEDKKIFHICFFTFQQKNVETYSRSLELMLEVMSRTTMPVC